MRLLCIANPDRYGNTKTDVPLSYAYLAKHPEINLFHVDTKEFLRHPGYTINAVPIDASFNADEFSRLPNYKTVPVSPDDIDLTFCRTLKPFPTHYLDYLIDWSNLLQFVNNPAGLYKQLDHRFLLKHCGEYLPTSINTVNRIDAEKFFLQHGTIVIKQANSCGGRGVFRVRLKSDNSVESDNAIQGQRIFHTFDDLFAWLTAGGKLAVTLSKYLPRVIEGDKRIVVIGGDIYGAYLRKSSEGHWVQNVSLGSHCRLSIATAQERKIIAATQSHYHKQGLPVLGYDFLRDDKGKATLSEINAGNVGGLARLEQLGKSGTINRFVNWLHSHDTVDGANGFLQSCASLESIINNKSFALNP